MKPPQAHSYEKKAREIFQEFNFAHDCVIECSEQELLESRITKAIQEAVEAERERCLAALPQRQEYNGIHDNFITGFNNSRDQAEAAIRAQGKGK